MQDLGFSHEDYYVTGVRSDDGIIEGTIWRMPEGKIAIPFRFENRKLNVSGLGVMTRWKINRKIRKALQK